MIAAIAPWLEDLGKLSAILVAFGGAVAVLWRAYKSSRTALAAAVASEIVVHLEPVLVSIEEIRRELTYNSGSSLKDITHAIQDQVVEVRREAHEAAELAAGVAAELAASHSRADAVPAYADPGVAADAASKTG